MKVAIVAAPYFPIPPNKYGGTEQVIHHLINGLLELGHKPILLGPKDSKVNCEVIPIVSKSFQLPSKHSDLPIYQKKLSRVNNKIDKLLSHLAPKVDVIHSHGYDLSKFKKFPTLTTLHNPLIFEDLDYYHERKNHYYISISRNYKNALPFLQYIGVIYNGEDPSEFPIVHHPEDYLCFLGRFEREKSPHLAINLAIKLGMKIKVAGKIDFHGKQYFEDEVKPLFANPLVEYLGELGFKEKVELLSKAKCNLHPLNFREPFGLTVLEAAYCGTPTLTVRRGAMPELVEQGRTGLLVEDFFEGYHRINECFEMDRNYIARRARTLFNYKTMTRQYVRAYQTVIDITLLQKKEDKLLQQLTSSAREELLNIWQTEEESIHKL